MLFNRSILGPVLAFLLLTGYLFGTEEKAAGSQGKVEEEVAGDLEGSGDELEEELKEESSVTQHTGVFGGERLEYTATAGTLLVSKMEDDPVASMFYVAYTLDGVEKREDRPITFCFNGGPGSSSVWLHLGGFGPKRVHMTDDGMMPDPPFRLEDNPESILRVTDLVFIDPVSTGFSRSEDKEKASEFHNFQGDLDSIAEFIRLYTTRNERWLSPKFLAGESYGALRAAALASELHDGFGLYLNGIVLVSGVLSFDTLWGSDLSYVTFLPALSEAAAWHGKLDEGLLANPELRRAEVAAFAEGEYATALLQGSDLSEEAKNAVASKLAHYTGIDAEIIVRLDLRIPPGFFREELLRQDGLIIGRFDSRLTGRDGDRAGNSPAYDPSFEAVYGPFSAALNDYVRRNLEFESDLIYEILSTRVRPWDFGETFVGRPINVLPKLASVLSKNPSLKIMVNCGYQDLATPFSGIEHSLRHLDIDPGLLSNIEYTFYEGGHMMYTIRQSNAKWNRDVARFIEEN